MATIKDIAKAANVSIATVSMVLNNKDCITKKTKDKVLKAAKELNYIPSVAAKTLKTNKSKTISLLIGDIANPFFPGIIKGAQACARNNDYDVFIYDLSGADIFMVEEINKSLSQKVDGVFITGTNQVEEATMDRINSLCDGGLKVITSNRFMVSDKFPIIIADESDSIKSLLYKLIALGHKNIGCISGKKGYWVSNQRENYYQEVMKEFNLYNPNYITNTGFFVEEGKAAIRALLTKHPEITAIMCTNDTLAIGASTEAKAIGLSIPDDLSIFGVDGIEYLQYHSPIITTVDTLRYEYGYEGAKRLIEMIENEDPSNTSLTQDIILPCIIKEGGSIAAPRIDKEKT
jgi:DNA-binding LacI/PurR family transcriptional regulator